MCAKCQLITQHCVCVRSSTQHVDMAALAGSPDEFCLCTGLLKLVHQVGFVCV